MAIAATLLEAANITPANLQPLWAADTLQAKVIAFWQAIVGDFPDEVDNNQPVGNWIAIIAAFAPSILPYAQEGTPGTSALVGLNTIATFNLAVDYIYRFCKFASVYSGEAGGTAFITATQATAILAAYNAQFS